MPSGVMEGLLGPLYRAAVCMSGFCRVRCYSPDRCCRMAITVTRAASRWPHMAPSPRQRRASTLDGNSPIFILARINEALLPVLFGDNQPLEVAVTVDSAPLGQLIHSQWVIPFVVGYGKGE